MINVNFIIPVFNNNESLETLSINLATLQVKCNVKIIYVNDGSTDNSLSTLRRIRNKYKNIDIINLAKNYGQTEAIFAGLSLSESDYTIVMSADLQEPISLFAELINSIIEKDESLIICNRENRNDGFLNDFFSEVFWFVINKLSGVNFPKGGFDTFLMNKKIVGELINSYSVGCFIPTLLLQLNPTPKIIDYTRGRRMTGVSQWSFIKKLKFSTNILIEHTNLPILYFNLLLFSSLFLSIGFAIYTLYIYFFKGSPVEGWTALSLLILFSIFLYAFSMLIVFRHIRKISQKIDMKFNYRIESINEEKKF